MQKINKKLEISNQELEQFAYVASHDLQEPLRMVASYLQLISKRFFDKLDDDGKQFINFAVDGSKRMQALINDLLNFSRVSTRAKPFSSTDMNEIMLVVKNNISQLIADRKVNFSFDEMPTINTDYGQIIQLLQNLVINGIKFNTKDNPEIHVSAKDLGSVWQFSVKDNGIGISPEHFERIFVIFQRLHLRDKYEGTGIGLAVCKKIVERHGGKIWVESEENKGTTFYFTIEKT